MSRSRCGWVLLPYNFISELENAVATRSDKTGTMLRQITDLFLLHAGHYSAAEVGIYDDVLQILVTKVDVAARATLARRLAPIDAAPPNSPLARPRRRHRGGGAHSDPLKRAG